MSVANWACPGKTKPKACKAGAAQSRHSATIEGRATTWMWEGSAKGAVFALKTSTLIE